MDPKEGLSSRGFRATKPSLPYLDSFLASLSDVYDRDSNENGHIHLIVAENKLPYEQHVKPKLKEAYAKLGSVSADGGEFHTFYDDMKGKPTFKMSMCKFLTTVLGTDYKLLPENVMFASGCGAILDSLAWCLCEDRDGCIIPAPAYPAFDNDLSVRSGLNVVHTDMEIVNGEFSLSIESLEAAYTKAVRQGSRPKMLLVTNPQNPSGRLFKKEELRQALAWTREKNMHFVSDEVYAMTANHTKVDGEEAFTSMLDLCEGELGDKVHIVYGFSKDFGLSGFRIGCVYTENQALHCAMNNLSYFTCVSSSTQQIMNELISDEEWVNSFAAINRRLLNQACISLLDVLEMYKIPYIKPSSGFMLLLDFGALILKRTGKKALEELSWQDERDLYETFANTHKVHFTPGEACHCSRPGFFRCCYAAVTPEAAKVAFSRLFSSDKNPFTEDLSMS